MVDFTNNEKEKKKKLGKPNQRNQGGKGVQGAVSGDISGTGQLSNTVKRQRAGNFNIVTPTGVQPVQEGKSVTTFSDSGIIKPTQPITAAPTAAGIPTTPTETVIPKTSPKITTLQEPIVTDIGRETRTQLGVPVLREDKKFDVPVSAQVNGEFVPKGTITVSKEGLSRLGNSQGTFSTVPSSGLGFGSQTPIQQIANVQGVSTGDRLAAIQEFERLTADNSPEASLARAKQSVIDIVNNPDIGANTRQRAFGTLADFEVNQAKTQGVTAKDALNEQKFQLDALFKTSKLKNADRDYKLEVVNTINEIFSDRNPTNLQTKVQQALAVPGVDILTVGRLHPGINSFLQQILQASDSGVELSANNMVQGLQTQFGLSEAQSRQLLTDFFQNQVDEEKNIQRLGITQ